MSLQVHLPGHHLVVFNANDSADVVRARAEQEKTMLTGFFELNRKDPTAHQYTYQELPLHFVWEPKNKEWKDRQRGGSIGRLYFVSPTAGERFYLRTLLTTIKGPTSWEDACTVDGVVHPTFHATCLARGLLENDDEWRQCLEDASLTHLGESLRRLFCLILRHCTPSQPHLLWIHFQEQLCDDLSRRLQRTRDSHFEVPLHDVYDFGLFLIDEELHTHGSSLSSFPSMPSVEGNWGDRDRNPYIDEQHRYDTDYEERLSLEAVSMLNIGQRDAFD
jgi:hypothetical protein